MKLLTLFKKIIHPLYICMYLFLVLDSRTFSVAVPLSFFFLLVLDVYIPHLPEHYFQMFYSLGEVDVRLIITSGKYLGHWNLKFILGSSSQASLRNRKLFSSQMLIKDHLVSIN